MQSRQRREPVPLKDDSQSRTFIKCSAIAHLQNAIKHTGIRRRGCFFIVLNVMHQVLRFNCEKYAIVLLRKL